MPEPQVFLSHAGADSKTAKALAEALQKAEIEVWLDIDSLKPGDRWQQEIESAVGRAEAFVVLVGRTGVRNWVDREVRLALVRNTSEEGSFPVIPVLGPDADIKDLPGFLAQHQCVDLRDGIDNAKGLKDLAAAIRGTEQAVLSLLPANQPPFRGLQVFESEHAHLFFGRDREVGELLDLMSCSRFLAVVGGSGTGKSSLVRAGLIPALNRGRYHESGAWAEGWRIAILRPGADPFDALASALPDLVPDADEARRIRIRAEYVEQMGKPGSLHGTVDVIVPAGKRVLLVVDQFEELFTTTTQLDVRRRFIAELLDAMGRAGSDRPLHILITLRADFYGKVWSHPDLLDWVDGNEYRVKPLDLKGLREVIEKPLMLAGARLEPALAETILKDAGGDPGTLPLLEHVLLQLWQKGSGREITHQHYDEVGRLTGALEVHAESVFGGYQPERQTLMQRMLLRLVQPGEGTEATRKRAPRGNFSGLARPRRRQLTCWSG